MHKDLSNKTPKVIWFQIEYIPTNPINFQSHSSSLIVYAQLGFYKSSAFQAQPLPPPHNRPQQNLPRSAHVLLWLTCRFVMQIFCFHLLVIYRKLLTKKKKKRKGRKEAEDSHFYAVLLPAPSLRVCVCICIWIIRLCEIRLNRIIESYAIYKRWQRLMQAATHPTNHQRQQNGNQSTQKNRKKDEEIMYYIKINSDVLKILCT